MIVRDFGSNWLLIFQTDHALQCAAFAAHWGNRQFEPPSSPAVLSAALHDNGWREWENNQDDHTWINPSNGNPRGFTQVRGPEHFSLYERGIKRVIRIDSYAGLLVSMHGAGLHNGRFGLTPGMRDQELDDPSSPAVEFTENRLIEQRTLRQNLIKDRRYISILSEEIIWSNYLLLQAWDALSLHLCMKEPSEGKLENVPVQLGKDQKTSLEIMPTDVLTFSITPYPFDADVVSVPIKGLVVPKKYYVSDNELLEEISKAETYTLDFKLVKTS